MSILRSLYVWPRKTKRDLYSDEWVYLFLEARTIQPTIMLEFDGNYSQLAMVKAPFQNRPYISLIFDSPKQWSDLRGAAR